MCTDQKIDVLNALHQTDDNDMTITLEYAAYMN